ncbi:DNA topoisomerase [Virgibacillus soli]|uniref:DNA topoisomerase n=1 Tax=Paracerasibacillus soli TaxID=480284 RepID=A0ABU5CWL8_9BACI|nr:DNA topoisomerase [Virgibacillus soli]MDY0409825.1 DNA topoisomerase [Virgibacillus soli]
MQSPTVYLIYQRQREIETFVSEPFFEVEAQFTAQHGVYKGKAKLKEPKREIIANLLRDRNIHPDTPGTITELTHTDKRMPAPQLHSLSTLQATANRRWKASPAIVLKTMQTLYEKKIVSYPRTDARHITPAEFAYLSASIEDFQNLIGHEFEVASRTPKKRFVDSSKVNEHHAIIPTKKLPTAAAVAKLSPLARNLYEEIVRTTLAMFHRDYLYTETKVTTNVNGLPFFTTGRTERDKGWKELFPPSKKTKNSEELTLPQLEREETVQSEIAIKEGKTQAPKPYTEGQLIAMMKTCGKLVEDQTETNVLREIEGLGTEATRSGIIETIKKHGYISVTKNIVAITDKGRVLCQAIEGSLLASPSMTAKWETYLRKIGNGEGTGQHFLNNVTKFIQKLLQDVPNELDKQEINIALPPAPSSRRKTYKPKEVAPCPACGNGTIVHRKSFYGCSNYKNGCKQTFPGTFLKKRLTPAQVKLLCTKGRTSVIKGFTSSAGKKFDAPLEFKDGKLMLDFK